MPSIIIRLTTPRAVLSSRYGLLLWRVTRSQADPDCILCRAGTCYQRVEWGRNMGGQVIIHGHLPN